MSRALSLLLLVLLMSITATTGAETDRRFGLVIGDVITRSIDLPAAIRAEQLNELARPARIDAWLERMALSRTSNRPEGMRLTLHYQLINSPKEPRVSSLPALDLSLVNGQTLVIAAEPFGFGPLRPDPVDDSNELPALLPDTPAATLATTPARQRLRAAAALLALAAVTWLLLTLHWYRRTAMALPFNAAWRTISQVSRSRRPGDASTHDPEWTALHRAFDQTLGRTMTGRDLDALFARHGWLRPLQDDIEAFHAASASRFFAMSAPADRIELPALARSLATAERRAIG